MYVFIRAETFASDGHCTVSKGDFSGIARTATIG